MTPAPITWTRFRLEVAPLSERLQVLLEEENPDEVARSVALEEADDGCRILGPRREGIAVVSPPQLEDRVRRGVVIRRSPGGDCLRAIQATSGRSGAEFIKACMRGSLLARGDSSTIMRARSLEREVAPPRPPDPTLRHGAHPRSAL